MNESLNYSLNIS